MSDPRYEFLRFRDLKAAGIVSSRYDLHTKIHKHGFPKPLKDGAAMQAAAFWRKSAVHAWLDGQYPQPLSGDQEHTDEELKGLCSFYRAHHADPDAEMRTEWLLAICQRLFDILDAKHKPGRHKSATGYAAEDVEIFRKKFGWSQEEARRAVAHWRKMDYGKLAEAHRRLLRKGVQKHQPD